MVYAHHFNSMFQVSNSIHDRCFAFFLEETMIKCDMGYTTFLCQSAHLIVCKVTRNIAKHLTIGVTADNWLCTYVQSIIETLLTAVTQVDHYAITIHLFDDFSTELAHSTMRITATSRVTNIIVTVMTQSDIDYATLCKVLHILQLML